MSAPDTVTTVGGGQWKRSQRTRDGVALYALTDCGTVPSHLLVTLAELAEIGIESTTDKEGPK